MGIHIDVSHEAATPPGLEITATAELIEVKGKKLTFNVEAHDGVDLISKGQHIRFVINKEQFDSISLKLDDHDILSQNDRLWSSMLAPAERLSLSS